MDTRRFAYARDVLVALAPDSLGVARPVYWWGLAWLEHMLGDHRSELATTDAGIRTDGRWWPNLLARTRALAALGESEALEEILDELLVNTPREPLWGVRQRREVWSTPSMSLSDLPHLLALELRRHGHPEAANRLLGKRIAFHRDPERGAPPVSPRQLAGLLYEHGEHTQADSIARVMLADTTDPVFPSGMLGLLAASRGDRAEAERWARELARVERPYVFGDHTLWRAQIAAKLGDDAEAIELLRRASAEGMDRGGWWWVHVLAEFDDLRRDPAFQRLLAPRR